MTSYFYQSPYKTPVFLFNLFLLFGIKTSMAFNLYSSTATEDESFMLKVDFSRNSSMVQDGYLGYLAEHENDISFQPQTYTINGNVISIDVEWPDGTAKEAKQMIDRGEDPENDSSNLIRDWVGTDGRKSKVKMDLIISGLPAGLYEWKSYHHDNNDQTGIFNVTIEDANAVSSTEGIDISNGILFLEKVTVFESKLKSDGSDIVLSFKQSSYPDNSTSFFVMNGFELTELDENVMPEAVQLVRPLNQLSHVSLDPELKWTDSYYASEYNVNLGTTNPPEFYATTVSPGIIVSSLDENTTYYWSVEAVNNNGSANSEIRSFTTGVKDPGSNTEELTIDFSHERNYYNQPFELNLTTNYANSTIVYTLDCSVPSIENGLIYDGPITIDSTIIVKALALSADSVSKVYTNSYLFSEFIAKQGKEMVGFPEYWGGVSLLQADYEMDPEIINHPDYSTGIDDAFKSIPSLSLTMDVDEWFDPATGLYVGYPNSSETREKAVTAEFLFNENEESFAIECGVQNQGGTSIVKWKVPKQSMRLLFKEIYGPTRLRRKLFPDSEIESINTLVVDGLLYSWLHPWDEKQRTTSLYFRDQLASDLQNDMGGLSFHGRYVNLYLNGLYWGIYDLHERPDDAFLSEYLDAEREDFDIIKHNPNRVVSGSNEFYLEMLEKARLGFTYDYSLEAIQKYLDLPAFIDYMVLNFYLGNFDWAHQNYYAARNKIKQTGFRFYTWDAEHVMRYSDVDYDNTKKDDEGGPTEIHTLLKKNSEYRLMFADAVYKHFYNDGALTPANFEEKFLFRANEIEEAIILESARWGDFREEKSGLTYTKNDFWTPEVNKVLEEYIPNRREIVIEQLRDYENRLFPKYMPPEIEVENLSGDKQSITLVNPNSVEGDIYFTIDGTDPRLVGGTIFGTKYAGKIQIENSTILKARFYSKADLIWSALNEKIFLFDDIFGENIVINEIMYHPDNDYPEFIELINFGQNPINLNGFTISGGIEYLFRKNEVLQPGAGIVLTNDTSLFRKAYDFSAFGMYQKQLSNKGETVFLFNALNQLVDSVSYSDSIPWPEIADGDGYSIELIASEMDNALFSSWKSSSKLYGTPYRQATKLDAGGSIYPNPFTDIITVEFENSGLSYETFKIEVFNQTGSKVREFVKSSYNSKLEFNLSGVLAGMYFIRVQPKDNSDFKEVVFKAVKIR